MGSYFDIMTKRFFELVNEMTMSFSNEVTYYWMSRVSLFQFKLNSISTNIIITNNILLQKYESFKVSIQDLIIIL